MHPSINRIRGLVEGIVPFDDLESEHRLDTLRWLEGTGDVFRRVKPATPRRHLVSYVVLTDPSGERVLLVDHVNARLWLPPGGHVEPGEDPVDTARRELGEELGIVAPHIEDLDRPIFVTVTQTVGIDHGHTDVSLWFRHIARTEQGLRYDHREFTDVRWWLAAEVAEAHSVGFDPHMARFLGKLRVARAEV